jgi:hypothetical protein
MPNIMVMWPLTLVTVYVGSLSIKGVDLKHTVENERKNHSAVPFFKELVPIFMVILVGLTMGTLLSRTFPGFHIARELG